MNKSVITSMALMMLLITGCASSGGAAGAGDNGGLPEIAAYDDDVVEPLPDMVPAEM